jgi:hypothetical protein
VKIHETRKELAVRAIRAFVELVETADIPNVPTVLGDPKISYSLKEAAACTGTKVCFLRKAVTEQVLPGRLMGKKIVILHSDLVKFVTSQPVYMNQRDR